MTEDRFEEGLTRRGWIKGALAVGVAGVAGASGASTVRTLASDPSPVPQETFLYVDPQGARLPVWWKERGLVGEEARLHDFTPGDGANVLWRWHLTEEGAVAGGLSALLMRVDEEVLEFPAGYRHEDFVVRGLYAVFNCCTHACCRPGWRLTPRAAYSLDLGYDTIFCPCHCAQFHPTRVGIFTHPGPPEGSGATYIGVVNVAGPAKRGMPLIPLEVRDDRIVGKLRDPNWYRYLDTMRRPLP